MQQGALLKWGWKRKVGRYRQRVEAGGMYSIKNIINLKTFFKYFSPSPQPMVSSGGANGEREENIGDVSHVRADEGYSRHSRDDSLVEYVGTIRGS